MHRGIDDSAKAAFEQALSHAATRAQIADHLFASQEYRRDEVHSLYQQGSTETPTRKAWLTGPINWHTAYGTNGCWPRC